jgi:hypothetical protein
MRAEVRRFRTFRRPDAAVLMMVPILALALSGVGCQRPDRLASDFSTLSASLPGTVGVAFGSLGDRRVVTLGSWRSGVAWSTSKVPLAVAALRAHPSQATPLAVQAITASDNEAAEKLWALLGPPEVAARAVDAVLRDGSDDTTRVQSQQVRPPYTAFGQTVWTTTDQARFAAHLPCIRLGPEVVSMMKNIIPQQRWGMTRLAGAAAKGGWGPDPHGAYLVREFGLLPNGSAWTAVAMAAEPASGRFADGIALLDRLADWLAAHHDLLPVGRCH